MSADEFRHSAMTFPKEPLELYTRSRYERLCTEEWRRAVSSQHCLYLGKKCDKTRKSNPQVSIGTCMVGYSGAPLIICPHRFLQASRIFIDTLPLLKHSRDSEFHVVPNISLPGGSVDYFVVCLRRGKIEDYLGVEIQAVDTTGTVWPSRQKVVRECTNLKSPVPPGDRDKSYGVNWKMTAKTTLVQLHHKVESLELLGKKMVLAIQDVLFRYIEREFTTKGLRDPTGAESLFVHTYSIDQDQSGRFNLVLRDRKATTTAGIEEMLGRKRGARVPEEDLLQRITSKISGETRLRV